MVDQQNASPAKKILVVEDDPDLLEIMSFRIKQAGYQVVQATDGKQGYEVALREHPDLILLDIMMPEVTGLQMLKALRQDEWGAKVHVFLLTSVNRSKEMSEGMNYNVDKYIVKADLKYDQLLASIKQYLQ